MSLEQGIPDPATAYCTEMVLGKVHLLLSPLGRRWWRHGCMGRTMASSKTWSRAEFGLAFRTASTLSGRQAVGELLHSVYRQFTGYLLGCFGCHVSPLEVLVSGSAAQPGLPEVDPPGEQEAAGPRFDAALQQRPDFPAAAEATVAGEQGVLLTKHPGGADFDHRRSQVIVFHH